MTRPCPAPADAPAGPDDAPGPARGARLDEARAEGASDLAPGPGGVLVVRPDGGANCSSVGSVVDLLFVAGAVGGALLVAVTAALDDLEEEADEPPPPSAPEARPG